MLSIPKILMISVFLSSGCFPLHVIAGTKAISTKSLHKQASRSINNKCNLNTATAKEIANAYQGFGPKRAQAIINYRTSKGKFKQIDDLQHIPGISRKYVKKHSEALTQAFIVK